MFQELVIIFVISLRQRRILYKLLLLFFLLHIFFINGFVYSHKYAMLILLLHVPVENLSALCSVHTHRYILAGLLYSA